MSDTSFGPLVNLFSFLSCFIDTECYYRYYSSSAGLRRAVATRTGPNDVRHVVWVFGKSVLFSFVFY